MAEHEEPEDVGFDEEQEYHAEEIKKSCSTMSRRTKFLRKRRSSR